MPNIFRTLSVNSELSETPNAHAVLLWVPNMLVMTGISNPFTFSNDHTVIMN